MVVCTHLHVDHVGWNTMLEDSAWVPTFPNARYLIGGTGGLLVEVRRQGHARSGRGFGASDR